MVYASEMSGAGYLYALDRHGLEQRLVLVEPCQTVGRVVWKRLRALEVGLDIEMGISVFLVEAAALFDNLPDLGLAGFGGFFIRSKGIDAGDGALGSVGGSTFGVEVVGQDGKDLAGVFCGEIVPELVDALLGCLLASGQPQARRRDDGLWIHAGCSGWGPCDVDEVVVGALGVHGHA